MTAAKTMPYHDAVDQDALDEAEVDLERAGDEVDGLMYYLHEIGQFDFLKREEEIGLSRDIQAGQLAGVRLASTQPLCSATEDRLRRVIAEARAEAARLGIWCGLPAERPEGWSDAEHLAEDIRLANVVQAGHLARFTMSKEPALTAEQKAEFEAQIARAKLAIQDLGLPWSKSETALDQLEALDLPDEEKQRLATLFTDAQTAYKQLCGRPPRDETERTVLKRQLAAAKRARDVLVERNLRLVVNMAKRYTGQGLELDDLTGFGNIGLIEGAEKYDWRRGTRFSTYASLWIRQRILRGMSDTARTIRIPSYRVDDTRRINRAIPDLIQQLGHNPGVTDIAREVNIPVDDVRRLMDLAQPTTSLDRAVSDEEADLTYASLIPDPDVNVENDAMTADLRRIFQQAFRDAKLDKRQIAILRERFEEDYTFDMIATEHGLTRERVRQIIAETKREIIQAIDMRALDQHLSEKLLAQFFARAPEGDQVA